MMCEYLSFVVDEQGDVYVGYPQSHGGVAKAAGLDAGAYREAEWTDSGLTVRTQPDEDDLPWRERVLRRWESREALEGYLRRRGAGRSCPNETGEVVEWDLTRLPEYALLTQEVGGSLFLDGCTGLTSLPEGLSVGGDLSLGGCTGLTSLPEGLNVGGSLSLGGCTGLTSLPEGLNVGGSLSLDGCTGLTSLPEGLNVGGSLFLDGCTGLTSLPEGLSVGGDLYLDGCTGLTSLPEGLSVGGDLSLGGCTDAVVAQAREMSDGIAVYG